VESDRVHSALRPSIGLLCQPRVIMMMEKFVESWLAWEREVLRENLPQCRFVNHKPHMPAWTRTRAAVGWKPATNRLSYGTEFQKKLQYIWYFRNILILFTKVYITLNCVIWDMNLRQLSGISAGTTFIMALGPKNVMLTEIWSVRYVYLDRSKICYTIFKHFFFVHLNLLKVLGEQIFFLPTQAL
jgi:hypothetical protein